MAGKKEERESLATFRRITRYDQMIASGSYPSVQDFRDEFEISEATVHRDLDALRDDFGAGNILEYDRCKKGYFYNRPTFRIPALLSTEKQIAAASLMVNLLESVHGTPLYNQAVEVFATLAISLDDDGAGFAKRLSNRIVFLGMNPVPVSDGVWNALEKALAQSRLITFDYSFYDGSGSTKNYLLEPWQLLYSQGMWTLYGKDLREKKTKFFNLPLISNVAVRDATFELPKDFEYTKRAKGNFGRYIGNETHRFKIKITSKITANYIKTYKWADDQQFKTQRDGSVVMTFTSNQYYLVLNWLLSHGRNATPLEPKTLVEEWKENVRAMVRNMEKA